MSAFLTGSRRYGRPTEQSGIDLVVKMTPAEATIFLEALPPSVVAEAQRQRDRYGAGNGQIALRFGPLNLIICTSRERMEAWRSGTRQCVRRRPVDREESAATFHEIFERQGLG